MLQRNIRQHLETFPVVTAGKGAAGIEWVDARNAVPDPTMHRTAPRYKMSVVWRLRHLPRTVSGFSQI